MASSHIFTGDASNLNDDNTRSTGSVLGDLIKEYGLDQPQPAQGVEEPVQYHILQSPLVNHPPTTTINTSDLGLDPILIENPTKVACPEEKIVFNLVPSSSQGVKQEVEEENEGAAIMANITGFGGIAPTNPGNMAAPMYPSNASLAQTAYVKVLEEPADNKLRFRYECEGRSAGALHGGKSSGDNKTYPTIQIVGYQGPAVCVVSLVEHEKPYRAHPHNLVGKDGLCKQGVCSVEITKPDMTYSFQNLGIQCVKRKDAQQSLERRQKIRVDPFKQGFDHKNRSIDLNMVRLCYQVFLKMPDRSLVPLKPVVSAIIKDRKAYCDLQIVDYSDDSCTVDGGKKILLFTEQIKKDDIEVHFTQYTKGGEQIIAKGSFTANDVHRQYGISLKTPEYVDKDITEPVLGAMYLYKPKTQESSEPVNFYYYPRHFDQKPNLDTMIQSPQDIKSMKRGREPRLNQDDPSSGQVNVPSKIPTAQRHLGGGQVTVIDQPEKMTPGGMTKLNEFLQSAQIQSPGSKPIYVNPRMNVPSPSSQGVYSSAARSPYEQVALENGNVVMKATHMGDPQVSPTGNVHDTLFQNQNNLGFVEPNAVQTAGVTYHQQPATALLQRHQGQGQSASSNVVTTQSNNLSSNISGLSSLSQYLQHSGLDPQTDLNCAQVLPNLNFDSGDLAGPDDMDNLSSNLDSNLKLGQEPKVEVNNLDDGCTNYQRQGSQLLHTPEVSSMSVDLGSSNKRNNLNRP
ncbi:transcription factor p65-like isoform X2 [Tigriopus californicus]|nr:transcription factor p65-like isoform X2 [Tigriopus californicus]XP_059097156.1 transcription factor p65-like isoform X2 [Tigriopus californicus]